MSKRITISIQGYGDVTVKLPKTWNRDTYSEGVAEAVRKTMQLVDPRTQSARFHPVLGIRNAP